jgi:hypothetical protein
MTLTLYFILFLLLNSSNALKKALLQCNFNSHSECISISLNSLESFFKKSETLNIELKTFLHKKSSSNENHYFYDVYDKLNDNHNKKSYFSNNCISYKSLNRYSGFPLLSIMESQYFKRILHPSLILNKTKKDLLKKFHRNVIHTNDNLIMVSVILPSKIYMLANSSINYLINSQDTIINSKDYSLNYSLWKISNFVNIQFGNFIQ